jgi:hypothetical protein
VRFTQGHVDMAHFCITEDDFEEMRLRLGLLFPVFEV